MLQNDYLRVFDAEMQQNPKQAKLLIGTIGLQSKAERNVERNDLAALKQKREGFLIFVKGNSLIVLGSDKRGTAYGLLELSRMMGVSPWEWWADSPVLS